MPGFPIVPAPPPRGGGQGIGIGVPQIPPATECPPCDEGTGTGSSCHGGKQIRASTLAGSACCIYHFHLSCAGVGDMGWWEIEYEVADAENPPDFDFQYWDQDPTAAVQNGYIPLQIDGHPGYSDEAETTIGYAAYPLEPPGVSGDFNDWAETAYLQINALNGGFSSFVVTCIPYDAQTQTMGDPENPLTLDLTEYLACPGHGVSAGTMNWYSSSGTQYPHPLGGSGIEGMVGTTLYAGHLVLHCAGEAGYLTDEITEATIVSGHVDYASVETCDAGCCFGGIDSCNPSIPSELIESSFDITTPVGMTQDEENPGVWLVDRDALGLDGVLVGVFQIQTNLGVADWIVAHSICF